MPLCSAPHRGRPGRRQVYGFRVNTSDAHYLCLGLTQGRKLLLFREHNTDEPQFFAAQWGSWTRMPAPGPVSELDPDRFDWPAATCSEEELDEAERVSVRAHSPCRCPLPQTSGHCTRPGPHRLLTLMPTVLPPQAMSAGEGGSAKLRKGSTDSARLQRALKSSREVMKDGVPSKKEQRAKAGRGSSARMKPLQLQPSR